MDNVCHCHQPQRIGKCILHRPHPFQPLQPDIQPTTRLWLMQTVLLVILRLIYVICSIVTPHQTCYGRGIQVVPRHLTRDLMSLISSLTPGPGIITISTWKRQVGSPGKMHGMIIITEHFQSQ